MDILGTTKEIINFILSTDCFKKGDIVRTGLDSKGRLKIVSWVKNEEMIGCTYLAEKQFSDYELFKAKYHYNNLIDMGLINGIKFTI